MCIHAYMIDIHKFVYNITSPQNLALGGLPLLYEGSGGSCIFVYICI
jgi:hypothetical protein